MPRYMTAGRRISKYRQFRVRVSEYGFPYEDSVPKPLAFAMNAAPTVMGRHRRRAGTPNSSVAAGIGERDPIVAPKADGKAAMKRPMVAAAKEAVAKKKAR